MLIPYEQAFSKQIELDGKTCYRKSLPENIGELFDNPLSLALWVAGDGNPHGKTFSLCMQDFSENENGLLQKILQQNFSVNARLVWHSNGEKSSPHLYLPKTEAKKINKKK